MWKAHTEPLFCGVGARALLAHLLCLFIPFRYCKIGLSHTEGGGVTQTVYAGVTHTDFVVVEPVEKSSFVLYSRISSKTVFWRVCD